jgi:hypothetical protein
VSAPRTAPPDAESNKAWDQIMKIAQQHALIVSAYGGVATLACPEDQRKAGVRETVLDACGFDRKEKA